MGQRHRRGDRRGELPPRTTRPTRGQHPLPPPHPHQVRLTWDIILDRVAYDAATDGAFPLISNNTTLTDAQVLAAYRYQPNLERRHHLLKSVQDAAPVLLHNPARIEALFCCQFLALLIGALIERHIRTAMAAAHATDIPLYPELRACTAPSTERIVEIFADLTRHELRRDDQLVQPPNPN